MPAVAKVVKARMVGRCLVITIPEEIRRSISLEPGMQVSITQSSTNMFSCKVASKKSKKGAV